jgi:hypothetical protein
MTNLLDSEQPPDLRAEISEHVRQILARSPSAGYYEVLHQWRERRGEQISEEEEKLLLDAYQETGRPRSEGSGMVWAGIAIGMGLHVLQLPLAIIAALVSCQIDSSGGYCGLAAIVPIMFIGVSQLLYNGPALLAALIWKRDLVKGLLIAAAFTFLLNAGCYATIFGLSAGV